MKRFFKITQWIILSIVLLVIGLFIASEVYINFFVKDSIDPQLYEVMTVDVDGVDLAYRDYFSDQEKVIVLVHGFLGNSYEYDDFFNSFPDDFDYRVIAFDLVGFGLSDKPLDYIYNSDNQANTILEAISLLEIESFILMAHSMGGDIAMRMTEKTENINALMLLSPVSPTISMDPVRIPRLFYTVLFKNYWLQRLGFNSAPYEPLSTDDFNASLIQNDSIPSAVLQKFSLDTDDFMVSEIVDSFDQPSLIIYGQEDSWTPPEIIPEYEAILTNVETHIIEKTGHLIYLENPEILETLIINFLNSLNK